jgi:hypothetical protein
MRDNMEKELAFFNDFLQKEYNLRIRCYQEKDDQVFENLRSDHNQKFYDSKLESFIRRPKKPESSWFEDGTKYIKGLKKKLIFQVKKYFDQNKNDITCIYVSSEHKEDNSYFEKYFIKIINNQLKIVSIYVTNNEGGFEYLDGQEFDTSLKLLKSIKFQPPSDPADLEEYNSE